MGERLQTLDPAAADPDGLMTSARAELAQAQQAEQLAADYRTGLHLLEAGSWEQAAQTLEQVTKLDPGYRDTAALLARARRELPTSTPSQPRPRHLVRQPTATHTLRHYRSVNAVAFSPDGRRLATASNGCTARVWDLTTGQKLLTVSHEGRGWLQRLVGPDVYGVAFSCDGRRLATASDDKSARVWDATNGQELLTVTHDYTVHAVAFSPDGRWLATASGGQIARVWDATSGQELLTVTHKGSVWGVAFSPDGRWLATASGDNTARIWDATSGLELRTVTHGDWVRGVAFSPDGRRLATASDDNTARIWDPTSGQKLLTVTHVSWVLGVGFSPDGRWLATASADKTARVCPGGGQRRWLGPTPSRRRSSSPPRFHPSKEQAIVEGSMPSA